MSELTGKGDLIDLGAIVRRIWKHWWWFGISVLLAMAVGYGYIKTSPKKYLVEASLLMADRAKSPFSSGQEEFIRGTSYLSTNAALEDDIAILMSKANVKRTLKRLDFGVSYYQTRHFLTQEVYDYPHFFVKLDSASLQMIDVPIHVKVDRSAGTYRVKVKGKNVRLYNLRNQDVVEEYLPRVEIDRMVPIGEPFAEENLSFTLELPEDRTFPDDRDDKFVIHSLDGQVNTWRKYVKAEPMGKESHIVSLVSMGEVRSKQAKFLNKLMETYIEGELYKRHQKGIKTINFIDDQLGNVKDTLSQAEEAMKQAQTTTGVMGSTAARSEALFEDRSRLLDEQSRIQSKIQYFSYILDYMRGPDDQSTPMAPSASNIDAPVLNNLIMDYIGAMNQRAQMNLSTKKSTPVLVALERSIQTSKQAIIETAQGLLQQSRLDLNQVNSRLGSINAMFAQLPENTRKLGIAQRRFDLSSELYNYLMEKRAEAGIAIASDQLEKYVVDEARMVGTKHVAPDAKMVGILCLLAGLLLPLLLLVARDALNDKVQDIDEVKRLTQIPVLGQVPSSRRRRITSEDQKSLLAESFRTTRINLKYMDPAAPKQVVGMTSSVSGEGKTFCAVNLATIMALSGKRTLLLEADLRQPRASAMLELAGGPGLSTFLMGRADVPSIIVHTEIPDLDVIPSGPLPPNPLELMESPRFEQLLVDLRSRYDQVIVDSSPLGLVSEYMLALRHVDVTLFVVRLHHTRRVHLRKLNELHRAGKLGAVELLVNYVPLTEDYGGYLEPRTK
ncbi:MAG: polysaccharide biosynthesis tyrosine autokinase [Flavobacteriales bacterium]|nr:polysaccharide biosynthesis tyrosine autokinase [Flavobacteriales bacterium]